MSELVRAGAVESYLTGSVRKLIPVRQRDLKLILVLAAMTCCPDFYTILNWIRQSQEMSVAQLAIYGRMDPGKIVKLFEQQAKAMDQILKHLRKQSETVITNWKIALNKQNYIWPNEDGATREWEILLGKKKPAILKAIPKKKRSIKEFKKHMYEIYFQSVVLFDYSII